MENSFLKIYRKRNASLTVKKNNLIKTNKSQANSNIPIEFFSSKNYTHNKNFK